MARDANELWSVGRRRDAVQLGIESEYLHISRHDRLADKPFEWASERRRLRHQAVTYGWRKIEAASNSWEEAVQAADDLVTEFEEGRKPFWESLELESTQWRRIVAHVDLRRLLATTERVRDRRKIAPEVR
jgi:hypothetical protein